MVGLSKMYKNLIFFIFLFFIVIIFSLIIYRAVIDNVVLSPIENCDKEYKHLDYEEMISLTPDFNPSIWLDRLNNQFDLISRVSSYGNQFSIIPVFLKSNWSHSNIERRNLNSLRKIHNEKIYPVYNGKQTVEDIRLFDNNIGIGTSSKPFKFTPVVIKWLDFNGKYDITSIDTGKWSHLFGVREKNWMIFKHKGKLVLHTHTYPMLNLFMVEINYKPFSCKIVDRLSELNTTGYFPALGKLENLRSTAPWVLWKGTIENPETYLTMFRTKTYLPRITHRSMFVEIDASTFIPLRYSPFICLSRKHEPIQFICGMISLENSCIISLGIDDKESRVISISRCDIDKSMKYEAKEDLWPIYEILDFPSLATGDFEPYVNAQLSMPIDKNLYVRN